MRAVWLPAISDLAKHVICGEAHHHLVNVVRIEVSEKILLLNGKGLRVKAQVQSISKKEVVLQELERSIVERAYTLDIAIGIPKREALELSLKEATELGCRRIFLVRGTYSQQKVPEIPRLKKLIISALEQSNANYLPEMIETEWSELPWQDYGLKLLMDSQTKENTREVSNLSLPVLLIVGPEGGFHSAELTYLHERPGLEILNLPTPILRTPTAVATGFGCLLQRLIDRR